MSYFLLFLFFLSLSRVVLPVSVEEVSVNIFTSSWCIMTKTTSKKFSLNSFVYYKPQAHCVSALSKFCVVFFYLFILFP